MESLSPQVVSAAKLPILNPNEFDLWKMRIEQYFLITDYSLWEVILNGDSPAPTRVIDGVIQPVAPTTTEERLARKNKLKARGTLLMALPDKHQLKFNTYKDAKTLMEAIEKSTNKPVSNAASVFDVSAKLPVSALLNVDSLSNAVIYLFFASQSNSSQLDNDDLKQIDADDLKEMDLKWQMAMLTVECYNFHRKGHFARECKSPKDTRRNGAAKPQRRSVLVETSTSNALVSQCDVSCSKACTKAYATLQSHYDKMTAAYRKSQFDFISNQTGLESLRDNALVVLRKNLEKAEQERDDLKLKLEKFKTSSKNLSELLASQTNDKTGLGYNSQVFTRAMFDSDDYLSSGSDESLPPSLIYVSDSKDESETKTPQNVPSFIQPTEQVKSPRPFVQHVETYIPTTIPKTAIPKPTSNGKHMNRKACFVCKSLDHLIKDYDYHAKKMAQTPPRNHAPRGNPKHFASMPLLNPQRHVVPAAVLTQSKLVFINNVIPVSTAVPNTSVTRPRHDKTTVTKPNSPPRRHINRSPSPKASTFPLKVIAVKALMGGKISRKGKIKTGKLDFDDVYFVKELKFNLFSVSQMCDKKNSVLFTDTECLVLSLEFKLPDENQVLLRVPRENNMYNVNLKNIVPFEYLTCLFANATFDESNLWHKRLGHINFKTMNKLVKCNLVRGVPSKVFENDHTCVAYKKGKQHRASCKTNPVSSVDQPLYRLHMDLFGPTFVKSLNKKSYCLVVTDDYSRMKGIKREFSVPRTPQQNGIAERKNRTLNEAARTMLADSLLPIPFWVEAANTACYVQNRVLVTKPQNKTLYELLHGRTPSIGFMRTFGCLVTILNTLDSLGKFDGKVDEGFFIRYSVSSKAFRVFNSRTRIVQETLHVNFLENKPNFAVSGPTWRFDIDTLTKTMNYQPVTAGNQSNHSASVQEQFNTEKEREEIVQQYVLFPVCSAQSKKHNDKTKREAKGKSLVESLIGYRNLSAEFEDFSDNNINEDNAVGTLVRAVGQLSPNSTNTFSAAGPSNAAASPIQGKSSCIDTSQLPDDPNMPELEDITYSDDEDNVGAEADFNNSKTSITVSPILTTRVHKDHHKEGIDYEEVFAPVPRIEAIRLFLSYASFMGFMVYQMDVKSAFLYGTIEEKVYVYQPPGFEDPDYLDKVYKVVKTLYGLHQAPRAWYETLANYPLENGFQRGKIDQTLFIKTQKDDILLVQIYVDDIIFGLTNKDLFKALEKLMKNKFQMSSMGELTFFLGLQVKQKKDGIFINQDKYVAEILRKFSLTDGKSASTPIDTEKPLLKDPDEGIECLPNEEIFVELVRMGYEKPSTKLTFYKAFFSIQWKFLVHTILQCMSAKRMSWNVFSSSMASVVICLSTGRSGVKDGLFGGKIG
uniref:Putative ribonuclease H-like domain-containing protein n=1 Tax=Tanacetum cinerariifolium TaxID=118510 RepID=A0A6L2NTJ7_TANCI|nr:putative ribonuclease H-like domain-containing protein [Tanacetum cinerariifolium]